MLPTKANDQAQLSNYSSAKSVGWNIGATILPALAMLATMPLLARNLPPDQFGHLGMYLTCMSGLNLLDLGLSRNITQSAARMFATGNTAGAASLTVASIRQVALFAFVVSLAGALLFWNVRGSTLADLASPGSIEWMVYSIVVLAPATTASAGLRAYMEAIRLFKPVSIVRASTAVFSLVLPALTIIPAGSLRFYAVTLVVVRIVSLCVQVYLLKDYLLIYITDKSLSIPSFWKTLRSGAWPNVVGCVGPLMVSGEQILMPYTVSLTQLGRYAFCSDLMQKGLVIPSAVGSVFLPTMTSLFFGGSSEQQRAYYMRTDYVVQCLVVCASAALFTLNGTLVRFAFGPAEPQETSHIVAIFSVGFLANGLAVVPCTALYSSGRVDLIGKSYLIQVLPYLVATLYAQTSFGVVGAAIVWSLRCIIDLLLMRWMLGSSLPALKSPHDGAVVIIVGLFSVVCFAVVTIGNSGIVPAVAAMIILLLAVRSVVGLLIAARSARLEVSRQH